MMDLGSMKETVTFTVDNTLRGSRESATEVTEHKHTSENKHTSLNKDEDLIFTDSVEL